MIKSYDDVMWDAVMDTLEEMYQNSYPAISWKQMYQDSKEGKDVDKDLISHHYIPQELYEDIRSMAESSYGYEKLFNEYTSHFIEFLTDGGYGWDTESHSLKESCQYPPIKEAIGEEAWAILEKRLQAYKHFYRFDHKKWAFNFTIMNYAPCTNRQTVIDYWKSQGIELEIPSDDQIISKYWGDEDPNSYGPVTTE